MNKKQKENDQKLSLYELFRNWEVEKKTLLNLQNSEANEKEVLENRAVEVDAQLTKAKSVDNPNSTVDLQIWSDSYQKLKLDNAEFKIISEVKNVEAKKTISERIAKIKVTIEMFLKQSKIIGGDRQLKELRVGSPNSQNEETSFDSKFQVDFLTTNELLWKHSASELSDESSKFNNFTALAQFGQVMRLNYADKSVFFLQTLETGHAFKFPSKVYQHSLTDTDAITVEVSSLCDQTMIPIKFGPDMLLVPHADFPCSVFGAKREYCQDLTISKKSSSCFAPTERHVVEFYEKLCQIDWKCANCFIDVEGKLVILRPVCAGQEVVLACTKKTTLDVDFEKMRLLKDSLSFLKKVERKILAMTCKSENVDCAFQILENLFNSGCSFYSCLDMRNKLVTELKQSKTIEALDISQQFLVKLISLVDSGDYDKHPEGRKILTKNLKSPIFAHFFLKSFHERFSYDHFMNGNVPVLQLVDDYIEWHKISRNAGYYEVPVYNSAVHAFTEALYGPDYQFARHLSGDIDKDTLSDPILLKGVNTNNSSSLLLSPSSSAATASLNVTAKRNDDVKEKEKVDPKDKRARVPSIKMSEALASETSKRKNSESLAENSKVKIIKTSTLISPADNLLFLADQAVLQTKKH